MPQPQPRHPAYELCGQHPAIRLMLSQKISSDVYLQGEPPPTPHQVAAVLHALADHTHNRHMLSDAVASLGNDRDHLGDKWAQTSGLGRYVHGLGDYGARNVVIFVSVQLLTITIVATAGIALLGAGR